MNTWTSFATALATGFACAGWRDLWRWSPWSYKGTHRGVHDWQLHIDYWDEQIHAERVSAALARMAAKLTEITETIPKLGQAFIEITAHFDQFKLDIADIFWQDVEPFEWPENYTPRELYGTTRGAPWILFD